MNKRKRVSPMEKQFATNLQIILKQIILKLQSLSRLKNNNMKMDYIQRNDKQTVQSFDTKY